MLRFSISTPSQCSKNAFQNAGERIARFFSETFSHESKRMLRGRWCESSPSRGNFSPCPRIAPPSIAMFLAPLA